MFGQFCIGSYMILCPKCKIPKPQENFYKRSDEKYYRSYCKDCDKKDYTEFRKKNPHISHLSNAKQRAKKLNLCFDLDKVWFYENLKDTCPIFKTPFGSGSFAPSIDRIDSKKGYTKDNCQIISMRANRIKNDATIEELQTIVNYLNNPTSAGPAPS
jgi:hypothetical protein